MDKKKYVFIAFPVIVALVIVYLCCLIPPRDIPRVDSALPIDKVVHFLMYVGLAGSCFFSYIHLTVNGSRFSRILAFLWCLMIPVLFGGLIEIIQNKYCPGRSGDWYDFLADSLGVLFVLPFAIWYKHFIDKKYANKK